jgi:uncharacterized protein YdeI (YjbR/CyaY-like superfamily)
MNTGDVDSYLRDGCGRCEHYQKPSCKVHLWTSVLEALREIARSTGLDEEMKWGSPCYTLGGKNVVMIGAFKERCVLSFFKGAALVDESGALTAAGPNSRVARWLEFRSHDEVLARRSLARGFIEQAIALERAGVKVAKRAEAEPVPIELAQRLEVDSDLRRAFEALTPGRRRSHLIHITGAKQSETRARRVERCATSILAGRGFNER